MKVVNWIKSLFKKRKAILLPPTSAEDAVTKQYVDRMHNAQK